MKNSTFWTILLLVILFFGFGIFLQKYQGSSLWLWHISNGGKSLFPLVVVSAIVDSLTPCAFSILLVTIIFLFSLGRKREQVLSYGLIYIFGIFLVYFLIGLGVLHVLNIFSVPHFMSKVGALMLAILGLINLLGGLFHNFPIKFGMPHAAHSKMNELVEKVSLPAMFLLGALVGLCEFPCTGGPYLMILGLLHDTKTYWQGATYLLFYNLLFIVPLILVLFLASTKRVVDKVSTIQHSTRKSIKIISGLLMIGLAAVVFYL